MLMFNDLEDKILCKNITIVVHDRFSVNVSLLTMLVLENNDLEANAWVARLFLSSNPHSSYPLNVGLILSAFDNML